MMNEKQTSIAILSIESFRGYPVMYLEVTPYRELLMSTVADITYILANVDTNELTEDIIVNSLEWNDEWLKVYVNTNEPEVLEKQVIASLKEYFYHAINSLGGLHILKTIDRLIFAGDYYNSHRSTLHVHKIKTNTNAWEWDDYSWVTATMGARL